MEKMENVKSLKELRGVSTKKAREEREEALLQALFKASSEKPLTRREAARAIEADDRTARVIIQSLRERGVPICSSPDFPGYWLAKSEEELEVFVGWYTGHAREIFKTAKKMTERAAEFIA